MNDETLLLRQVHPHFVQNGRITSQAFRPTPKDESLLSCYNGDKINAHASFEHFVAQQNCQSSGVVAVNKKECDGQGVPVVDDAIPFFEHCSLDFGDFSPNQIEKKAKYLKYHANARGWLFQAESTE